MNLLNVDFKQPNISQTSSKRDVIDARPIRTDNLLKPSRPETSHLVNDPIYMAPINFIEDIKDNVVNIKNALKGKSNDHDLGRINDFAMKAGALGLAGYLFTRARTPMSKVMEFVGFGSFFASMALWPKLFIELPVRAMYGRNFNQKYIDNEGRKKRFSQDPQYKPWDLYTPEQISKMGDRLGIPKNIHNRNEVIKAKADKIDLQANTLWMLTAGFATPLMSGLICNRAEKYIAPKLEQIRIQKKAEQAARAAAQQNITFDKNKNLHINEEYTQSLDKIFNDPKKTTISEKELNKLVEMMTHNNDIYGKEAIKAQLLDLMPQKPDIIDKSYMDYLFEAIKQNNELAAKNEPGFHYIDPKLINKAKIESMFEKNISVPYFRNQVLFLLAKDKKRVSPPEKLRLFKIMNIGKVLYNKGEVFDIRNITDPEKEAVKPITYKISPKTVEQVQKLDKILIGFSRELESLGEYHKVLLNNEAESVAANRWINTSRAFFDVLGIKGYDVDLARHNGDYATRFLTRGLEELAKDDKAYEDAYKKVSDAILEFDKMFLPDDNAGNAQGLNAELKNKYAKLFKKYRDVFEEVKDFPLIQERIYGREGMAGSLRDNLYDRIDRRISELRSGMYKMLHAMDVYKRVQSGEMWNDFVLHGSNKSGLHWHEIIKEEFPNVSKDKIPFISNTKTPEELEKLYKEYKVKHGLHPKALEYAKAAGEIEESVETITKVISGEKVEVPVKITKINNYAYANFVALIKERVLDATIADHLTKFGMRNPSFNSYNTMMRMMYSTNLASSSEKVLSGINLGNREFISSFKDYINQALLQLGKHINPHHWNVVIDGGDEPRGPVDLFARDTAAGPKLSDVVRERASQVFNSSKWLKRFGGAFAVLVGITLLSETFFGKLNKKEMYVKKG